MGPDLKENHPTSNFSFITWLARARVNVITVGAGRICGIVQTFSITVYATGGNLSSATAAR